MWGRYLFVIASMALWIGCDGADSGGAVSGEVIFDGQPIMGMVAFEPLEGGQPRYVPIQNGRYEAREEAALAPGTYRVRVTGSHVSTATTGPSEAPLTIDELHALEMAEEEHSQILPEAWNTASELTVEVSLGSNTFHFRGDPGEDPQVSSEN